MTAPSSDGGSGMGTATQVRTQVGVLAVRVRGDGPPAILWHSLFVDERSWHRVVDELGRERRLVIITGPGHGRSGDPGHRYTLGDCAAAAVEILGALGIGDRVDWVGNAWGGHVGLVFAATWPERCRTLLTLGTPVHAYTAFERRRFRLLLAAYQALGMMGWLARGIADTLLSPTTRARDHEALALVLDCLQAMERRALVNAMTSISLGRPDLTSRLAAIRCPTVFVTGSHHSGWSPQQARAASGLLADGSTVVVPETAYLTPLEAPSETIRCVRDLWNRT